MTRELRNYMGYKVTFTSPALYERCAACFDALEGIDDPAAFVAAVKDLTAQRDALLAACKQMVEDADWYSADTHDREAPHQLHGYELARAAIEKAEGKS